MNAYTICVLYFVHVKYYINHLNLLHPMHQLTKARFTSINPDTPAHTISQTHHHHHEAPSHLSFRHLSFSKPAAVSYSYTCCILCIRAHSFLSSLHRRISARRSNHGLWVVNFIRVTPNLGFAREYSCCCCCCCNILSSKRLAINERRSLVDGVNSRRARTPGD